MRLLAPLWLLALLPLAGLALYALIGRRGSSPPLLLRGLAGALLVLALSQPQLGGAGPRITVLAVDRSASVDARMRATERSWAQAARKVCASPCRLVEFAAGARSRSNPPAALAGAATVSSGASDLEAGLRLALRAVPDGGRVALLSDGYQTEGDALAPAVMARARGVEVDAVPLSDPAQRDAAITRISAPQAVHEGDSIPLLVTIRSTVAGRATLYLDRDGRPAGHQAVDLRAGDTPLLLSYTASRRGWQSFTARVALRGDGVPANDSLSAATDVLARPRLLLAGGSRSLQAMLSGLGFSVASLSAAEPARAAAGYRGVDALVLDDLPAASLSGAQVAALGAAVRDRGLGLDVLGGPHSLSSGGYATSPLEALLPVKSRIPGDLQRRNAAIELVLDRSGSMIDLAGGVPKIAMVMQAGAQTARYVASHQDELGVIAFDVVPHHLIPLQRLRPGRSERAAVAAIDGLTAEGGTNIFLALQAGFREVESSGAPAKHIVLVTDGVSQAGDYGPLLRAIRESHVSVATVALGSEADRGLLAQVAHATGAAYATETARALPQIFTKESRFAALPTRVTGSLAVLPGSDSPIVASLSGQALPRLQGNQITSLKQGAQASLLSKAGHSGQAPALAQWQLGAGRVAVWTPGIGAPWASSWSGATQLWNDLVRWSERPALAAGPTPEVSPGTPARVRVELGGQAQGSARSGVRLSLAGAISPGAPRYGFTLARAGRGLYTAALAGVPQGAYRFALSAGTLRSSGELAVPYSLEQLPLPRAATPLGALAAATGGRLLDQQDPSALLAGGPTQLWWPIALAALICFALAIWSDGRRRAGDRDLAPPHEGPERDRAAEGGGPYAASSPAARAPAASSSSGSTSVGAGR